MNRAAPAPSFRRVVSPLLRRVGENQSLTQSLVLNRTDPFFAKRQNMVNKDLKHDCAKKGNSISLQGGAAVACLVHTQEVAGSNPAPATRFRPAVFQQFIADSKPRRSGVRHQGVGRRGIILMLVLGATGWSGAVINLFAKAIITGGAATGMAGLIWIAAIAFILIAFEKDILSE